MNTMIVEKTIYVLDDDINIAKYHALMLNNHFNINCKVFDNPCKAYEDIYINREEVAGIITDVFMPVDNCNMNTGMMLIQKLKKDNIILPVLFCTALDGAAEKTKILQEGFYCKKPFEDCIRDMNSGFYLFISQILKRQLK